jgi:hypothetical protein
MQRRPLFSDPALRELATWRWAVALLAAGLFLAACHAPDATEQRGDAPPLVATGEVTVLSRTEHIPTYPCSRCHDDQPTNPKVRPLELHNRIHLDHMETDRWCYTCHSTENIDQLRLPNGKHVAFDDSSELCGACHGTKHRDWKLNIHGLTTGYWNGPKKKRACTACHNPHDPPFQSMKPLPPPERPRTVDPNALPPEHP